MHFGVSAGRAYARHLDAGDEVSSSRSGKAADARPLAALLAPHIQPGTAGPSDPVLVAHALPAGLGACSEMHRPFGHRP
jgi:hypothetical protein